MTQRLEKVSDGVGRLMTIDSKSAIAPVGFLLLPLVALAFLASPSENLATELDRTEGVALLGMCKVAAREGNWHDKFKH